MPITGARGAGVAPDGSGVCAVVAMRAPAAYRVGGAGRGALRRAFCSHR